MKKALSISKFLLAALALLLAASRLPAQNNAYQIDDKCFEYFQQAELLVGKDGFDKAASLLLSQAVEVGDTKAQTLYYVTRLKNTRELIRSKKTSEEDDARILSAMKEVQDVSMELGYPQYYYYAYELVQNYFFNHGKNEKAMQLVQEMRRTAIKRGDEYGIWMGNRYIVALYVAQNDHVSAKPYIQEAIKVYETTQDPVIKRQSATRLFCDMANTYPIGHDSVRINIAKAREACRVHMDTLRVVYHEAKLAAYDKDIARYERDRDYCLRDSFMVKISGTSKQMFKDIDAIVYGNNPNANVDITGMGQHLREAKYVANIAEGYGYKDLAFRLEKQIVVYFENVLAKSNRSRLTEIEARLGNDLLTAERDEETHRAQTALRWLMLLAIVVLAAILIFTLFHIHSLKKANEKVRMADAAKTRFVQNMSHEVRTPLNAIVGFSQLLSLPDGSFPKEEKEEFAKHIVNNTGMLTMLLDDILNISAMDSGNYRITYEDAELHFMCNAAISSAEHRLQPGVTMTYEPENADPYNFRADPRRVQQILINLLTNACKHTEKGSIVLRSSLSAKPGYVTMTVTDTGTGVPEDQAEAIFERFTKLNDFVQGTGLGLSICRDIAGRMGAKVYLDTTYKDGGARFVFELPCNPDEQ